LREKRAHGLRPCDVRRAAQEDAEREMQRNRYLVVLALLGLLPLACEQTRTLSSPPSAEEQAHFRQEEQADAYEVARKISEWELALESEAPDQAFAAISLLRCGHPKALKILIHALTREKDTAKRVVIIKAFGFDGDDSAMEVLLKLLSDSDPEVSRASQETLSKIRTQAAIEKLCAFLNDEGNPSKSRAMVAEALGELRDREAVEPLIAALRSGGKDVRTAAHKALVKISQKSLGPDPALWDEWWEVNKLKTREEWLEELVKVLEGGLKLLERREEDVRKRLAEKTIQELSQRADKSDPKPLIEAMKDPDVRVRRYAVKELAGLKWPGRAAELSKALEDEDAEVRLVAAKALVELADKSTLPALEKAIHDSNSDVRRAAIRALGRIGAQGSFKALLGLLKDKDARVAAEAATALGHLGNRAAVEPLISLLSRPKLSGPLHEAAVSSLGKLRDKRALPVLIQALNHKSERVRWFAAIALGEIGSPDAVDALGATLLKDRNAQVRESAANSLAKIGNQKAIPMLAAALKDKSEKVATQAADALFALAGEEFPVMLKVGDILYDNEKYRRAGKIYQTLLAKYGASPEYRAQVNACREKVAISLIRLGERERAKPFYEELCRSDPKNMRYRKALVDCLEALGEPGAAAAACAEGIAAVPEKADVCWAELVRILTSYRAQIGQKKIDALINQLEKKYPDLGGPNVKSVLLKLRTPKPKAVKPAPAKRKPAGK